MTKPFRGCRYEVHVHAPADHAPAGRLWSRHSSLASARKSYREAVNNRRGDHAAGSRVELVDILDGVDLTLEREVVHP